MEMSGPRWSRCGFSGMLRFLYKGLGFGGFSEFRELRDLKPQTSACQLRFVPEALFSLCCAPWVHCTVRPTHAYL